MSEHTNLPGWRGWLHEVIFEAETPLGKFFDIGLLCTIIASVIAVSLESVSSIAARYGLLLRAFEWYLTIAFSIEYALRLLCVKRPLRYATSFYGIVDLLAILPTYLSLFLVGTQSLLVIRAIRLLRIFRIFKLAHFVGEARELRTALRGSVRKIVIFILAVLTLVVIMGAVMYLVEGEVNEDFDSIPRSIYWAIVTVTTVGYGDIAPETVVGQMIASVIMMTGYAIIAVPTGIVTVELGLARSKLRVTTTACPSCSAEGHDSNAKFCKFCGAGL